MGSLGLFYSINEKEWRIMTELYQVGAITQTHGIRGEVKVFPMTDDVSRFKNMKELILDTGKEQIVLEVTSARPQKNLVILKFKGIDNINDVEKYKGCGLFVTKENRVKCKKDEYFIADLIGLRAIDEEGEAFGTISDVIQTGANDVYVVTTKQGEEVMIPAIKDCILEVSVEEQDGQAGYVRIHLLPGLLDLNNNRK
jgi:16S rRNA processing protein RimM